MQAIGAILLIANMVQVAAYTRRTEIGIMRLVGASRWYTQLPFLVEAMLAAFIGVVIAIVGLIVVRALFLESALDQFYQANLIAQGRLRRHPLLSARRSCCSSVWRWPASPRTPRCACTSGVSRGQESRPDEVRRNNQVVATNRKARHNYSILETFEAGVALVGTEVKSLRDGQASLADAFATVDDGEIWLRNLHIPEYHHGSWTNHAPRRNRKLLLHRSQIDNLIGKIRDGNLTLVPLSLYFTDGKVKVELALARGKQAHDKRQDMARRDAEREVTRELGRRAKGMTSDRVVTRADRCARLWRKRFRRRHRVAPGRRAARGAHLLPGGAGPADGDRGARRRRHLDTGGGVGPALRRRAGIRRVVVLRRAGRRTDLGGLTADGDPGGGYPGRRRPGAGGAARRRRDRRRRCWRWSRWCWSAGKRPMRTSLRTSSPRRSPG